MRKLVSLLTVVVLVFVVIFDVAKEGREVLGLGPVLILLTFGVLMWSLLGKITRRHADRDSGMPINLAIWSHSLLEGALAALSFNFGFKAGLIVFTALLVHLVPEAFAVITILKQTGFSYRYAARTYLISVGILLSSFGLLGFVLPQSSQLLLTALATVVAGGLIYIATTAGRKVFQAN